MHKELKRMKKPLDEKKRENRKMYRKECKGNTEQIQQIV